MNPKIINVTVKQPVYNYLNSIFRLQCLPELLNIFTKSSQCAKELTESYAAFRNLKNELDFFPVDDNTVYLHVGDGTYPRTSIMFAYIIGGNHISIDPNLNIGWVNENLTDVRGLQCVRSTIEDFDIDLIKNKNVILILVHSHVNSKNVIDLINTKANVIAAYINPCCYPNDQLLPNLEIKEDWGILSDQRNYQVYTINKTKPSPIKSLLSKIWR